ncbi:hypothetical protein K443DRAFT_678018 [Laccaria amethystina LaAM-08-1]|uniref:Zinc/iron permease n=1 Tax=Laccaria amethystina LaAM-08-1 TaxID=1095629 RepID=A0A0C9XK37_9AGAR|nr:hypothetical protein K443DRAFT_678018 [Laccaria amethystina LaAM-08-1]
MLLQVVVMSVLLGASSFGAGMLPLSFVFSKNQVDRLAVLGTGLLLGAALGVIIPEGVETIAVAYPNQPFPISQVALSLLVGFTLMLIIEQLVTPNAHAHDASSDLVMRPKNTPALTLEFDADLGDLENSQGSSVLPQSLETGSGRERAFPLTLGLVIHSLADGIALGAATLAKTKPGTANTVSFIVFLALLLHKAPTSLALTTSLIATNLPRPDCKKYLAVFSASTPLSAIASYLLFSLLGDGDGGGLTGVALLLSGGTFLYVATVLQPVSHHSATAADINPLTRVLHITAGIFIPYGLSTFLGHGH